MANRFSNRPVQQGGTYTLDILRLGHSGEGVGKYLDFTVFIPGALPGESVQVVITEVKKNYAKGKLQGIEKFAPERVEPRCTIYRKCGGCQLQHMDYESQCIAKRQTVVDAITRIGKLTDVTVHPTIGAVNPWYYRNKMQFPVGTNGSTVVIGCFAQGTHEIINTEHCFIQHDTNNVIAGEMRAVIAALGIAPYNERTGEGVIRHVLGRVGSATGEVMIVLVTTSLQLPCKQELISELRRRIPGLVSIIQNVNGKKTNVIMGEKTITLWGRDTITDRLGEFHFEISARSFFQVNTAQAEVLYNKAVEYAGLSGRETVIDAYCGTGTISLFLARKALKVYGIEIVAPAVRDAKQNAANNGVKNAEFITGDAVTVMPQMIQEGIYPDTIVVDPPRAGCDRQVLEAFVHMAPRRIVYVSCNPASLARDLAVLAEHGYATKEVQPVDMFPQTYHVECVALIERKKP
ncbi:MAG: 23S rRNA (uracil(1939)-C(5))-methyltransferase RlmD [Veillonellales bacterium]